MSDNKYPLVNIVEENTQLVLSVWDAIIDLAAFWAKQQARIWLTNYFREEQNKRQL